MEIAKFKIFFNGQQANVANPQTQMECSPRDMQFQIQMEITSIKRFSDKVAIVTGSSNGIGRAIAVLFARDGASVVITGRDPEGLKTTYEECISAGGVPEKLLIVQGDLTDGDFRERLVDETLRKFGKLDILINNAGALDRDNCGKGPGFASQDLESLEYILTINLKSIVSLLYLCLPHLERTQGDVVNMGSVGSLPVAMSNFPFYATSKAALAQLTRSLAYDYIQKGVRLNTLCPGLIATKLLQKQGLPDDISRKMEQSIEKNPLNIPAGYVGEPMDIAHATAFLADKAVSRYIVGATIVVDGGSHIVMPLISGNFHEHF